MRTEVLELETVGKPFRKKTEVKKNSPEDGLKFVLKGLKNVRLLLKDPEKTARTVLH